jgi:hypothetical protein
MAAMLHPRRRRPVTGLSLGFALSVALGLACKDDPSCSSCDAQSEYCAVSGSDVSGESSTFECVALPDACEDAPSCECLATVDDADSNLDWSLSFCLMDGACGVEDEVLRVVCPGG